jgi:hypothetical protein
VAEVVEAEWAKRRSLERGLVPARQRRSVEIAPGQAGEHEVVVAGPAPAVRETRQDGGDVRRERHRTNATALRARETGPGERAADAYTLAMKSIVAPTEGDQLAAAEAGESGSEEDRGVLLRLGRADECPDLLHREDLDRGRRLIARLLDLGHRVVAELVYAARALEHSLRIVRTLALDRLQIGSVAFHASIRSAVTSSSRRSPNAGSRCARMIAR